MYMDRCKHRYWEHFSLIAVEEGRLNSGFVLLCGSIGSKLLPENQAPESAQHHTIPISHSHQD